MAFFWVAQTGDIDGCHRFRHPGDPVSGGLSAGLGKEGLDGGPQSRVASQQEPWG